MTSIGIVKSVRGMNDQTLGRVVLEDVPNVVTIIVLG